MKNRTRHFVSFILLLSILMQGCEKNNFKLKTIDPDTQPSELSRALLIENAINHPGQAPQSMGLMDLQITNSQKTALITSDNFLFLPFVYSSNNKIAGVYLQIEGADNYWEIPFEPQNLGQSTAEVLSIGIPANVVDGEFFIDYHLFDGGGNTGNTRVLATTVELPQDYCADGPPFPKVEGADGVYNQSFAFGEERGFISIEFNTFSIPDRLDVRYNNEWIRSTGELLSGSAPPIKECKNVVPGDGFLGQRNVFNIYYDPAVSKKVDVYVSGCLDGGTAWEFEVKECPREKAILGIHSNVPPSNFPLEAVVIGEVLGFTGSGTLGHSWVSLTKNGQTTFYGLWPDDHPSTVDNGNGSDIRTNLENGFGTLARFYPLDESQEKQLESLLSRNLNWSYQYTCAGFSQDIFNILTPETIDGAEQITGFGTTYTPRRISEAIRALEQQNPTSNFRPQGVGEDSSSCSFCF